MYNQIMYITLYHNFYTINFYHKWSFSQYDCISGDGFISITEWMIMSKVLRIFWVNGSYIPGYLLKTNQKTPVFNPTFWRHELDDTTYTLSLNLSLKTPAIKIIFFQSSFKLCNFSICNSMVVDYGFLLITYKNDRDPLQSKFTLKMDEEKFKFRKCNNFREMFCQKILEKVWQGGRDSVLRIHFQLNLTQEKKIEKRAIQMSALKIKKNFCDLKSFHPRSLPPILISTHFHLIPHLIETYIIRREQIPKIFVVLSKYA